MKIIVNLKYLNIFFKTIFLTCILLIISQGMINYYGSLLPWSAGYIQFVLNLIWLPTVPMFLLWGVIAFAVAKGWKPIVGFLAILSPYLISWGILGLSSHGGIGWGIERLFQHSIIGIFLAMVIWAKIYGCLQIFLAIIIITYIILLLTLIRIRNAHNTLE